jgi:hypothetical protein
MVQDWDIRPLGQACGGCGNAFADGQHYRSGLVFGKEGYVRTDFCEACWDKTQSSSSLFSAWRGVYRKPPPQAEEPLKKETAESLLRRLMETEDRTRTNAIFVLAVMLERKRILAERDIRTRDDGVRVRVYEHKRTGETFLIPDPGLRLDQIEHVQREVVELLGGSPPQGAGQPPPPAPPESPCPPST